MEGKFQVGTHVRRVVHSFRVLSLCILHEHKHTQVNLWFIFFISQCEEKELGKSASANDGNAYNAHVTGNTYSFQCAYN